MDMAAAVSAYLTFTLAGRRQASPAEDAEQRAPPRYRSCGRHGREHVESGGELVAGTVAGAAAGDLGRVDGMPSGLCRRRTSVDS